jgi:hypothetical protein
VRTPIRPIPGDIDRWNSRLRWLRWLDGLVAWLLLAAGLRLLVPLDERPALVAAFLVVAAGAAMPLVRSRWRPVSGPVGLSVSRRLRPGDRAWYVRAGEADRVLITARHGLRMVIAQPGEGAEGLSVRRTRVLLIPMA